MDEALVRMAVLALQKHHTTKSKEKKQLIEENPIVSLIIGLKKTPNRTFRPHRMCVYLCLELIPHSLYPTDETEVCLFVRTNKKTAKELLEKKKIKGITKVIPLDKLKTDFKSFSSKRHLSCFYDVYLADRRIYHMLPQHLGKSFFAKKKFPFPVDMRKQDLSHELSTARDSTHLHIGLGSCVAVPIARLASPTEHIVENIVKGMAGVVSKIPRGWRNIQAVNIKTVHSISLPVYNSLPPEPKLLPDAEEMCREPKMKRVKLEAVEPSPLPPMVDITGGSGKKRGVGGEKPSKKKEGESSVGGEGALSPALASSDEKSEASVEVPAAPLTPAPTSQKKLKVRSVPRLSSRKVRGSTIISSRHEKIRSRRTKGRKSL